jgi:hypothetical protein
MPAPVPLPLTWHIYTTLHCPSCGEDWNVAKSYPDGTEEREWFCPNQDCEQYGHLYLVRMTPFACQIVKVLR